MEGHADLQGTEVAACSARTIDRAVDERSAMVRRCKLFVVQTNRRRVLITNPRVLVTRLCVIRDSCLTNPPARVPLSPSCACPDSVHRAERAVFVILCT